jgi:hypothetical protein
MDGLNALESANYLRQAVLDDREFAQVVTAIIERSDCDDMYDWADKNPEEIKMLVTSLRDVDDQLDIYAARLADGDLS